MLQLPVVPQQAEGWATRVSAFSYAHMRRPYQAVQAGLMVRSLDSSCGGRKKGPCSQGPFHCSSGENAGHVADVSGTSDAASCTDRMELNTRLNQSEKLIEVGL